MYAVLFLLFVNIIPEILQKSRHRPEINKTETYIIC